MSTHNFCSIVLSLWSLIAGIVTLTLNDKSPCAESYQTLMVLGIGLTAFSLLYFINCFISSKWKEKCFQPLVSISAIFVFLFDCMLIDEMVRGNQNDDCSGGRGSIRLFIVVSTVPFQLIVCFACWQKRKNQYKRDQFYGPENAEFQILL